MTANGGAIDEMLERFAATGPEFNGGLANHGPMAAEALLAMGRADAVGGWAEWYATRLAEHPRAMDRIDPEEWRESLGDVRRAGDWIAFFDREVRARPWGDAVELWVARLGPGIMAAATHGILRTAHAVRSLDRGENEARLHELAEGLGYWAARYQTLPGEASGATAQADVKLALRHVARIDASQRKGGLIFDVVRVLDEGFAPIINYVDVDREFDAFVGDLTRTFVRQYLANAQHAAIGFVHTVTAPSAARILAPHLSADTRRAVMRYAWQSCAAIYAAYGRVDPDAMPADPAPAEFDEAYLVDRAVAARDEHAIKFTEACLREYRLSGDGAFIAAARDVTARLHR